MWRRRFSDLLIRSCPSMPTRNSTAKAFRSRRASIFSVIQSQPMLTLEICRTACGTSGTGSHCASGRRQRYYLLVSIAPISLIAVNRSHSTLWTFSVVNWVDTEPICEIDYGPSQGSKEPKVQRLYLLRTNRIALISPHYCYTQDHHR